MKKLFIVLLGISAFAATSAFAGELKKDVSVMVGQGIAIGSGGDPIDGDIVYGLGWEGYKISDIFSVGGEFIYTGVAGDSGIGGNPIDYDLTTWGVTPYIKASKKSSKGGNNTDIYGLVGIGIYNTDVKYPVAYVTHDTTDNKVGLNFGGGIMFPIGEKMKLGLDIRYHYRSITVSEGSDGDKTISLFIPAVKFTYSF